MTLGVITYNHPHQKTQDLVCRLILCGYKDISLIVLPWVERKLRMITRLNKRISAL